jgi:hypothetical protein
VIFCSKKNAEEGRGGGQKKTPSALSPFPILSYILVIWFACI